MAPKKGGRGGKRSKKNDAALQEQAEAQERTLAEDQHAGEQPENGQEDAVAGRMSKLRCSLMQELTFVTPPDGVTSLAERLAGSMAMPCIAAVGAGAQQSHAGLLSKAKLTIGMPPASR